MKKNDLSAQVKSVQDLFLAGADVCSSMTLVVIGRFCYVITHETPTQTQTNIVTSLKEMYEREM